MKKKILTALGTAVVSLAVFVSPAMAGDYDHEKDSRANNHCGNYRDMSYHDDDKHENWNREGYQWNKNHDHDDYWNDDGNDNVDRHTSDDDITNASVSNSADIVNYVLSYAVSGGNTVHGEEGRLITGSVTSYAMSNIYANSTMIGVMH